ncbi:MAG: PilZ domain-containing protein [Planctomycetota bacterium]
MFTVEDDGLYGSMDAIDALKELSANTEYALIAARASERLELQTEVQIRPGNSSERSRFALRAITVDVSDGGCMLLSPAPTIAGDVYWLEFSDEHLRIGSLFARCMRCRMVSEDTFELGIKFMVPIDLTAAMVTCRSADQDGPR